MMNMRDREALGVVAVAILTPVAIMLPKFINIISFQNKHLNAWRTLIISIIFASCPLSYQMVK
jgi:hypothetical protein